MKYGYILNGRVCEYFELDENGKRVSGNIDYADTDRTKVKSPQQVITDKGLKPITTPKDFNGRYGDYNFAETETEIKLLDMTDTAKKETNKKQIEAEIISLKKQLAETDYITIKYSEAKSGARAFNNGEEEKCLQVIAERETTREKIRLLELQL